MQTVCSIDDWVGEFARIQKVSVRRNGAAIELPVGLGHMEIRPHEPPRGWYRLELVYPPGVTHCNLDGVPMTDFEPGFNRPLEVLRRIYGVMYGYRRALERAEARAKGESR